MSNQTIPRPDIAEELKPEDATNLINELIDAVDSMIHYGYGLDENSIIQTEIIVDADYFNKAFQIIGKLTGTIEHVSDTCASD